MISTLNSLSTHLQPSGNPSFKKEPCQEVKKTCISRYKPRVGIQATEENSSLDVPRTIFVHVEQFFDGAGRGVTNIFSSRLPTPLEELVKECAAPYDLDPVHRPRLQKVFINILPDAEKEILRDKIGDLLHVIMRLKSLGGMTTFLMISQPGSYKGSKFSDVLECLQLILHLHTFGLVNKEVIAALNDFHSKRLSVEQLLEKVKKEYLKKSPKDQIEQTCKVLEDGGCKELEEFRSTIKYAKYFLDDKTLSFLLNPISFYHVKDISPFIKAIHLMEVILSRHGSLEGLLVDFSLSRIGVKELEASLEKKVIELNNSSIQEDSVDSVLARFSNLSPSEIDQMEIEYTVVKELSPTLKDMGMSELSLLANHIRRKCQQAPLTKEDSRQLLGVVRESIRKEFGIYPNSTQMLSVIGLLIHGEKVRGSVAQINTGEGKSTIITILAFYFAAQGKYIDIIAPSRYLAERDDLKYHHFFSRFGITTSNLCTDTPTQANFSGKIIYSTNFDFEFALMRDYFAEKPMRTISQGSKIVERPFQVVIVDEEDNLFIDSALSSARIAIPGLLSMHDVYVPLFEFVRQNVDAIHSLSNGGTLVGSQQFFEAREIVRQFLKGPEDLLDLFLDERVEMLLNSTLKALQLQEGNDYIVRSTEGKKEIVIVDQKNTGRLAEKSKWSHGLHQALEVKENLPIEEEHSMPASLCHPIYFRKYEPRNGC